MKSYLRSGWIPAQSSVCIGFALKDVAATSSKSRTNVESRTDCISICNDSSTEIGYTLDFWGENGSMILKIRTPGKNECCFEEPTSESRGQSQDGVFDFIIKIAAQFEDVR